MATPSLSPAATIKRSETATATHSPTDRRQSEALRTRAVLQSLHEA